MAQELGDCILHRTHHHLTGECYEAITKRFAHFVLDHGMNWREARDAYMLAYEATLWSGKLRGPTIPPQHPVED